MSPRGQSDAESLLLMAGAAEEKAPVAVEACFYSNTGRGCCNLKVGKHGICVKWTSGNPWGVLPSKVSCPEQWLKG